MNCEICNKKSEHLEKHHIVPRSRGGKDIESNLINLCTTCHGLAHNVSFKDGRKGLIKEAVNRKILKNKIAREWLDKNEIKIQKKIEKLFLEDEKTANLILVLLENNRIYAEHLMDWYIDGKMKFKTSFTFY